MRKFLYFILIVSASAHSLADSAAHPLLNKFPEADVFSKLEKSFQSVNLVSGDIGYVKAIGEKEGYLANKLLTVEGEVTLLIHDHEKSYTALHVFKEMERELRENKFDELYQCDGAGCGDITGWQLYLDSKMMGDEATQHYVLARQNGSGGNEWYLQFYTVDLDGQPRSFLRIIDVSERPRLNLAFNRSLLVIDSDDAIGHINDLPVFLFSFDSAELRPEAEAYINALEEEVLANNITSIEVNGFADSTGPELYNQQLAGRRASAVIDALKERPGLESLTITHSSFGEASPVANNDSSEGRQKNRRVTVGWRPLQSASSEN